MIKNSIVEIPILDCEEHSPYMQATVITATRKDNKLYYLELSDLNKGFVHKNGIVEGDVITYKIQKKVVDGICETVLIVT